MIGLEKSLERNQVAQKNAETEILLNKSIEEKEAEAEETETEE